MGMIRVRVRGLVMDDRSKSPIVVLQEDEGERILPIWIGEAEARSIGIVLAGEEPERPLTHDLLLQLIRGLRAEVTSIAITSLSNNTFFAEIRLQQGGEAVVIDARPSDSIAIALRADAPVFVAEDVLESGQAVSTGGSLQSPEKTPAQLAEELRQRLEDMDPRDFGKMGL